MMHWGDFGMGYGFGWTFMILFWGLVILGLIYLVKMLIGQSERQNPKETAADVVKKRFANGEISKEEFEKTLQVLKQHD